MLQSRQLLHGSALLRSFYRRRYRLRNIGCLRSWSAYRYEVILLSMYGSPSADHSSVGNGCRGQGISQDRLVRDRWGLGFEFVWLGFFSTRNFFPFLCTDAQSTGSLLRSRISAMELLIVRLSRRRSTRR